ncbi:hypothetical protein GQ44DRAFT_700173 [Phaeosphaeriaceae sp. PMI808]|nr:hypothetical protein GQ44DRAFT_700173 [Phaeosphaeriaceae sp. PMI808]
MRNTPIFFYISLLASLISGIAAVGTIYRGDGRSPETVKASGGLTAWSTTGETSLKTLKWHVEDSIGDTDPFVSCTTDMEKAKFEKYLYIIDSSKVTNQMWDVNALLGAHNHAAEMEISVSHVVPWAAIVGIQQKQGNMYVAIPKPAKRAAFAHDARARLEKI